MPRSNPFAFPGIRARLNTAHPAAQNCRMAFVATGKGSTGGGVNLVTGLPAIKVSSLTNVITNIGACISATNGYVECIPTVAGESLTAFTIAGIFVAQGPTGGGLVSTTNANVGARSALLNLNNVPNAYNNGIYFSLANFPANTIVGHCYFFAWSAKGTTNAPNNAVLVDLGTGQTWSGTLTRTLVTETAGTYYTVGGTSAGNGGQIIAAASLSATYLSLPQLVQWAADPWSLWYPQPLWRMLGKPTAAAAQRTQTCAISVGCSIAARRAVARRLTIHPAEGVTRKRAVARTLAVAVAAAVTRKRAAARTLRVNVAAAVTRKRAVARTLRVNVASSVSRLYGRILHRALAVSVSSSVRASRGVGKVLAVLPTSLVSLLSRLAIVTVRGIVSVVISAEGSIAMSVEAQGAATVAAGAEGLVAVTAEPQGAATVTIGG